MKNITPEQSQIEPVKPGRKLRLPEHEGEGSAETQTGKAGRSSAARAKKGVLPALEWTEDEINAAKHALMRNLHAKKMFWDKQEECYVEVDDGAVQIAAAVAICNQGIGLPVQRIVRVDANFKDRKAELVELAATPSGREMLVKAGIIDDIWIAKNMPSESQQGGDSQKRESS